MNGFHYQNARKLSYLNFECHTFSAVISGSYFFIDYLGCTYSGLTRLNIISYGDTSHQQYYLWIKKVQQLFVSTFHRLVIANMVGRVYYTVWIQAMYG